MPLDDSVDRKKSIKTTAEIQRKKLLKAGSLHWFHWGVVIASVGLTIVAWRMSKNQLDEKVEAQFDREAAQVIDLITERMQKYEDALWGGVGAIVSSDSGMGPHRWLRFAETLSIDSKYPGINGIGVIYHVKELELASFLKLERERRPNFQLHPPHDRGEYWPITYIEPVATNKKAVGLDMAYETNRFSSAQKARDTGTAQVTGPIVLVQDREKTPGFLFYAPFYEGGTHETVDERQNNFVGVVYAPFIMKKFMAGTLDQKNRHVGVAISDGTEVLYDEHTLVESDFDSEPMFTQSTDVNMYGRSWHLDIRSDRIFRAAAASTQPFTILIGGITIDILLLILFVLLSRANRRAVNYADVVNEELMEQRDALTQQTRELQGRSEELQFRTDELQERSYELLEKNEDMRLLTSNLERSNADLEKFAYVASHDLQEPLRMVASYTGLLAEEYKGKLGADADKYIYYAVDGAERMQVLIQDLLSYSRIAKTEKPFEETNSSEMIANVVHDLQMKIKEANARVTYSDLPRVWCDPSQLRLVFQNLISNAIKFCGDKVPTIEVAAERQECGWQFSVRDDGIGFDMEYKDRVFEIFQRLHTRKEYEGSGMGLAICRRVIHRHNGRMWAESELGSGATFYFTIENRLQRESAAA